MNYSINDKVLFIGDIKQTFTDEKMPRDWQIYDNILDGIEIAAQNHYAIIGVVVDNIAKPEPALKALRQSNPAAKIILLAKMYEEPAARRFVHLGENGNRLADDYLICPASTEDFYRLIRSPSLQEKTDGGLVTDKNVLQRIQRLEELATTDELTGLKNRRYIWEFARQVLEHAKKENGRVTLLIFDIDDFKHYNDVYSHLVGDEILKQASTLIRRCCRPHDVVGRIGGDEFAVVFWDDPKKRRTSMTNERRAMSDHPKEAIFIAKRFRQELSKAGLKSLGAAGKGILTISGGLASFPRDGATIQELFKQADQALLNAKGSGKNRIYLIGGQNGDIEKIE